MEVSLTTQDKEFRAWSILSSVLTSSWVSYSWSSSIVSEMMIDLVIASTTWKQR